ncbi:MAG: hypothetical protein U0992_14625 [Planctomycetaceae bacterium]
MRQHRSLLAILLIGICGCGGGSAATLPSGRMVAASSDTLWMSQTNAKDTATLDLGGTKVVVAPTQITIDGRPAVTIAAQVKSVQVTRANRQLSVVADGATIYDAPINR